jgi:hypothetical protein
MEVKATKRIKSKQGNHVVKELVIIGNWAKTCKTIEQLETVEKFLDKKVNSSVWWYPSIDKEVCHFHLGVVKGMILTLFKIRFEKL